MAFIRALEEVHHSQVSALSKHCCPETIIVQSKEIARAARLILMIESLNCIEGSRDRRDDDLLPPLYERRDSLLVQVATFDLRARLLLLEPGLYVGLPYLPHCHKELLPLYLLNCTSDDVCFRGRKVLAVASGGDENVFTGSSERSAQQTAGAQKVLIKAGDMNIVDDYNIYIDGDCMESWTGTFVIGGETRKFRGYARGLLSKRLIPLREED